MMAMEMGTSAPAPMAWNTRAATSQVRLVDMATATDPTMNRAMHNMKSRRCPHTSERRPMSGIAAT